jgi:hypothetical protein
VATIVNEIRLYSPDIILVSESWIPATVDLNQFCFDNYIVFGNSRADRRGGGTLILARSCLRPTAVKLRDDAQHEYNITAIHVGVAAQKTVVCCAYRPPNTSVAESDSFIEQLEAINTSADVRIFAGDYNYPHIDWMRPSQTKRDSISNAFQHSCDEMGLVQCVTCSTLGDNVLDLVLLSHLDSLLECKCCPPIASSDHQAVLFSVNMRKEGQGNTQQLAQPKFDKADLQYAELQLSAVNWRKVFVNDRHVDDYVTSFMSVLIPVLTQSLPTTRTRSNKHKRTVPRPIRALILKKRRLWRKIHDVQSLRAYTTACDKVKEAIRQYINRQELDLVEHPNQAAFYKYVNRTLGKQQTQHQLVDDTGRAVTDDVIAACMFNREFASNFSPSTASVPVATAAHFSQAFNVTLQDTYTALASSSNSSPGPDSISGFVLRRLARTLALPLSIIFQQSLTQGVFPTAWKKATVIPIYKGKGSRALASSYRPISLCSTIGKTLERIVNKQVLEMCQPLCKAQHGFTRGRSTVTNLLCAERDIADCTNNKHPYDVITFDFSRAFDRVPHHLLIQELADRGITGTALHWLQSYLSGRTQTVRVANALSTATAVSSGVIQGSSLGPTLFTVYIVVYSVPNIPFNVFKCLINCLSDVMVDSCKGKGVPVIICGDLNLPRMDWLNMLSSSDAVILMSMGHFCTQFGLSQLVSCPTRSCSILDVVLSNANVVCDVFVEQPIATCDHCVVKFNVRRRRVSSRLGPMQRFSFYDYSKADWAHFAFDLKSVNWSAFFMNCISINDYWLRWLYLVRMLIEKYVPYKTLKSRANQRSKLPARIRNLLSRRIVLGKNFVTVA